MSTYRPSHNVSLTQYPSAFPVSAGDEYEISGLTRIFHTDRDEETAKADGDEGEGAPAHRTAVYKEALEDTSPQEQRCHAHQQ